MVISLEHLCKDLGEAVPQPDVTPDEEPGQRRAGWLRRFLARQLRRGARAIRNRRERRAARNG